MSDRRLVVLGPLPPPIHGVAVSTSLILANERLRQSFRVEHLDTTDARPIGTIGRWDIRNVALGLSHLAELVRRLGGEKGTMYLPLSSASGGFLRDSLFIGAARARGWRVAGHLRGGEFLEFYTRLGEPLRSWVRRTLVMLDSIAVMGTDMRGMFTGFVPTSRVAVVPNGTPDPFGRRPDGPRDPIVLFVSNLRERKGIIPAMDAAHRVLERDSRARFVFVGAWSDAAIRDRVLDRARPWGERIVFLTNASQDEKLRLLERSSVFLFPPTEPEGHPRVVLEAIAAGLPCVVTDQGAIRETVGDAGFVLPSADPATLADTILRLLRDGDLRERLGRDARRRYEERFTQDRADRALASWLERVAA